LEVKMRLFFDDGKDFNKDLDAVVQRLDRWNNPLVVVPTDKDAGRANELYSGTNVRFISYDYWLSKRWLVDDNFDHIDFFRVDQFLMSRSYGVKAGCATVRRTVAKKEEE
jgi:hypothetical protein